MISLYKVTATIETFVLASSATDAIRANVRRLNDGAAELLISEGTDLVTGVPISVADRRPTLAPYTYEADVPVSRRAWTCAQWAEAAQGDAHEEAERLCFEATKAEATAANLRAQAKALTERFASAPSASPVPSAANRERSEPTRALGPEDFGGQDSSSFAGREGREESGR